MKRWISKGLLFGFLLTLISCATTMNMIIEVEKPAVITLPLTTQRIIIVNNALPQPVGYGLNPPSGKQPDDDSIYVRTLENAAWLLITETFNKLKSSEFFPSVSFYKQPLREGSEWLSVIPLKKEVQDDFLENEQFDLLISIDRLLFSATVSSKVSGVEDGSLKALLTFSAYLHDRDEPVISHLTVIDSVRASYNLSHDDYDPSRRSYEHLVSEMVRYSIYQLGEKLRYFFAPGWESAERIYFVKNLYDMGKTAGYIDHRAWDEAKLAWTSEFETAKKAADKAKLATNIALACEMNDEFSAAGEWAEKAKTFFQNASSKKHSKEIKYLDEYVKVLQERERNNVKLNEQYGVLGKR
ncbi:MAG: DUF6340 family protein [Dysgonamonadaceae bacterium]|jgi:hypothetical protein|nr:DUF6340 family protein [Dysgonamonadaceae bacterium]